MANQTLFEGQTYKFRKEGSDLILTDASDNSDETKTFRKGMIVSGSTNQHPIEIKSPSNYEGLKIIAVDNATITATLSSVTDDGHLDLLRTGTTAFKVDCYNSSTQTEFIYGKSATDSSSRWLMRLYNSSDKGVFRLRSDGKTFLSGGDFYVSDTDANTDNIRLHITGDNGYFDYNFGGDMHFRQGATTRMELDGSVGICQHWRPMTDNAYNLGTSTKRWDAIYAHDTSVNSSSDERLKKEITDSNLGLSFINRLRPVSYKWKNNGVRPHYGLIAQEVSSSLAGEGIHTDNFGGYVSDDIYTKVVQKPDSEDTSKIVDVTKDYSKSELIKDGITDFSDYTFVSSSLGLRYGEFISPLIKAVQELSAEVTSLKARVTELENN
jgi:hypothetical protein